MPGRRDRSGSGDPDKEASAATQQSTEGTAASNEQAPDSQGTGARYGGVIRDNTRPSSYSGRYGSGGGYDQRAGKYYDRTYRRDEERRPTGRFGERVDYEYDEPGYRYGSRAYRADDERGWHERASDTVASWFGDEEAEHRLRMDQLRQQNRGKGPKGYRRSDERIREDVNDRLSDDYYVDASDIEVQAADGLVVLTGTVSNLEEKHRAEGIAESVSGVRDVENRLRVRPRILEQDPILGNSAATSDEAPFLDQLGTPDREGNLSLAQTVREAIQEESVARNYVTARYSSLIDRKYLGGLSPSEENELEALQVTLEEMDQPYYEAIGERLRTLLDQS